MHLVYWYGTPRTNLSHAFSFVKVGMITAYKDSCMKEYNKHEVGIGKKHSKQDMFVIRGLQEADAQ